VVEVNRIICGDCLEVLKTLPAESVSCCISSPPYWALRDYGVDGQLGLEATFEEYIDKLCTIYDEVKRVLRKDGTCWVNLGDTYSASITGNQGNNKSTLMGGKKTQIQAGNRAKQINNPIPLKSLCLIPQRFAIEMVNRGWILRNVIIWHKPNPMPSSAKDRFTVDFEQVFFFTKSKRYFFEPQYEEYLKPLDRWGGDNLEANGQSTWDEGTGQNAYRDRNMRPNPLGRNKRTVWTIPTQPFPEAHFATYPEKLVEPMIEAGCPKYICTKCGTPRKKVYEKGDLIAQRKQDAQYAKNALNKNLRTVRDKGWNTEGKFCPGMQYQPIFKGYSDCGCGKEFEPGIVLDPFAAAAQRYTWPLN